MYVKGGICVAVSCGILEICENVKYVCTWDGLS